MWGNSLVSDCQSWKVPKHNFGHFLSLERHAVATKCLEGCDFLLVFSRDLRSKWNLLSSYKVRRTMIPSIEEEHNVRSSLDTLTSYSVLLLLPWVKYLTAMLD